MQAVPVVFAVALVVLTIVLVVVGIQVVLTMAEIRKTLKKVDETIEKSGLSPELKQAVKDVNNMMNAALGTSSQSESKRDPKKRTYVRKTSPSQFKGI